MNMRKFFAGVAAAATLLGGLALGAATANAAGTATITVHNSQTDHTYTAYKFATFSNPQTVDGKTSLDVATDTGWNDVLKNALTKNTAAQGDPSNALVTEDPTGTFTANGNDVTAYKDNWAAYVATLTPEQLRTFADNLDLTNKTGQTATGTDGEDATINTLDEGWYIVTDTKAGETAGSTVKSGATAIVASTLADTTAAKISINTPDGQKDIEAVGAFNSKGEDHVTPPPTKKADKTSVNVGDTIDYTITSEVPSVAAGYETYPVIFTDKSSKGLDVSTTTANFVVKVLKGNADDTYKTLTVTTDYTIDQTGSAADADGTTTKITVANAKDYAGKTIQVTYTGIVTADAVDDQVTNTASVKNNNDTESKGTPVTVKTAGFNFQKINKANEGLNGVKFNVYSIGADNAETQLFFTKDGNADGKYVKSAATKADEANGVYGDLTTAKVEDKDGSLYVRGLADGTYKVKETAPLASYDKNFLAEFTVTVTNGKATIAQDTLHLVTPGETDNSTATVLNVKSAAELPLTGAAGTALFTVLGILLAGAAVTVYTKSRSTSRALRRM